jgi:hypothetical protein
VATSDFEFVEATKEASKARVALAGPSGSGKTMTGLIIATRLADGGKTAVIDTERGSASKYAGDGPGLFRFKRLNMYRYDPRDLVKALASAAGQGFDSVLIDSLSRFWSGAGGMLEFVDGVTKRSSSGNSFSSGWKEARPIENEMIEAILGYPGHVVVTMRVKTAYETTKIDGKTVPVKIGLQPEQRGGIEYEFDVVADMDQENNFIVSKSRCSDLSGRVFNRPDHTVAETLLAWLTDGVKGQTPNDYRNIAIDPGTGPDELRELYRTVKADGKLAAMVMDDNGHVVSLHELITRKGKQAAGGRSAEGAAPQSQPAVTEAEHQWVLGWRQRLTYAATVQEADALRDEVTEALAKGPVQAGTSSALYTEARERRAIILALAGDEPAPGADDVWLVKIKDITELADADALEGELRAAFAEGNARLKVLLDVLESRLAEVTGAATPREAAA